MISTKMAWSRLVMRQTKHQTCFARHDVSPSPCLYLALCHGNLHACIKGFFTHVHSVSRYSLHVFTLYQGTLYTRPVCIKILFTRVHSVSRYSLHVSTLYQDTLYTCPLCCYTRLLWSGTLLAEQQ